MEILKKILQVSICFFITLGICTQSLGTVEKEKTLKEIQQQIISFRNEFKLRLQKAEKDRLAIHEHIKTRLEDFLNKQQSLKTTYPEFKEHVEKLRTLLETYDGKIETLEQTVNTMESTMNTHLDAIEKHIAALQRQKIERTPDLTPQLQPTPPPPDSIDFAPGQLFRAAYRFYMEGDYDMSIAGFQKFMVDYPDHQLVGAAQYWIAESLAKLGDYETAVQEYDYLINTYPKDDKIPDAYYGKGIALLRLEKPDEAKYHFTYIVEHFPGTGAAKKASYRLEEIR